VLSVGEKFGVLLPQKSISEAQSSTLHQRAARKFLWQTATCGHFSFTLPPTKKKKKGKKKRI